MFARTRSVLAIASALALLAVAPAITRAQTKPAHADSIVAPPGYPNWQILPLTRCPGDSLWLQFSWCSSCAQLTVRNDHTFVLTAISDNCVPAAVCARDSVLMPLGAFNAGSFTLVFTLISYAKSDSSDSLVQHIQVNFEVPRACGASPLPYVESVGIHGANTNVPPCEGDSIGVTIAGTFPDNCHRVRRADWVPRKEPGVLPPVIRLLIDDEGCSAEVHPCQADSVPFAVELTLPPLPAGDYLQPIALWVASCTDSFPDTPPAGEGAAPFRVRSPAECGSAQCFIARFPHPDSSRCDTAVGPDGTAQVTLEVASATPLAGLQGTLAVTPAGLVITQIEPVGPAAGWHLTWKPTASGADFVMFTSEGALIPAIAPDWFHGQGVPVLRVKLAVPPQPGYQVAKTFVVPPVTRVVPLRMIAADSLGHGVAPCPAPATFVYDPRLDPEARICFERPCDANNDGVSDVRDLVLMVRCLQMGCPDSLRFDCNGDNQFDLGDALCCALAILRGHAPPDSNAHPPDAPIAASFGPPVVTGGVVHVPLTLSGAGSLSTALMQLRFPADRYTVAGIGVSNRSLMPLHSAEGGDLAVGYIDLSQFSPVQPGAARQSLPEPNATVELDIQLALRPGATPGGDVELVDGQFANAAGQRVAVTLAPASIPMVPPDRAQLSAARPNPFARETRFAVDLPRAAHVELSVHDLSGRRVATVFTGDLPAGRREFTWTGATA